ncbi:Tn3 family transposase [Nonomuraea wenchangensis]|nr:Tn3 family transposase [Nonomuraea wenchangensis]
MGWCLCPFGGSRTGGLAYSTVVSSAGWPTYRRRIARQLNKGENLHALRRSLAYAGEGALRRRHHEQQTEQMWCLTLATNAIVCWSTEYHGLAVGTLRRDGRQVDDEILAHIWPTHHENVHFYGTHSVDVDGELAKLEVDGYRPLRPAAAHVNAFEPADVG